MDTKFWRALALFLLFDDATLGNSYYILLTQQCWNIDMCLMMIYRYSEKINRCVYSNRTAVHVNTQHWHTLSIEQLSLNGIINVLSVI